MATAAHFSTYAYPALVEFRETVLRQIAKLRFELYSGAGEDQCARMLQEYAYTLTWATHEQEDEFKQRAEKVFRYAGQITSIMRRPNTLNDGAFHTKWRNDGAKFSRIPRFRVGTDVVAESGATPPRTGVYMPQEDPYAALQFAWTGRHGALGNTYTLSDIGRAALAAVGRTGLWGDTEGLLRFAHRPEYIGIITSLGDPVV